MGAPMRRAWPHVMAKITVDPNLPMADADRDAAADPGFCRLSRDQFFPASPRYAELVGDSIRPVDRVFFWRGLWGRCRSDRDLRRHRLAHALPFVVRLGRLGVVRAGAGRLCQRAGHPVFQGARGRPADAGPSPSQARINISSYASKVASSIGRSSRWRAARAS
jgi:hypothetical protein